MRSADQVNTYYKIRAHLDILDLPISWNTDLIAHALRKPGPGEPSSLENLEQTEILPEKVYQTEKNLEQTEIWTEQTENWDDQDA